MKNDVNLQKKWSMRISVVVSFMGMFLSMIATSFAQIGGKSVYQFLSFNNSSTQAALGGSSLAMKESDLFLATYNPSFLNPSLHTSIALNFTDYFSNASYGSLAYAHHFEKIGMFAFSLQTIGYGSFLQTDEMGNQLGNFTAGDYALTTSWGRQLDSSFSIGANLKLIYAGYESYHSFGLAVDVAGSYYNQKKDIMLTLLVRNAGSQLKPFVTGSFEPLPFDIQLAFSQKLQHLPLRYHISLHSLHKWNLVYVGENDPLLEKDGLTGEFKYPSQTSLFFDNFFRHFIFGIEILPVKYLSFQFAYNHQRRQEMKIPQKRSFAGFSYGFSLNISAFQIGFSRAHFATGATPNYFTFAANINELTKLSKQRKVKKLQRVNE